ncbi:hypothetical protein [Candidatus Nanohalovita haloferacivicina]|uniref:hypothetical protein n=1 Tax=Candidatus Nanohalovita haloferacivicina TaxID=2978046 RepID=UPI00325FC1EF|nr:hypothetical protein HBNXNv_1108 [Candidatus Nanohalobia archaeon BNXNv]
MDNEFAVILVAGLAVFGLFWVASQNYNFNNQATSDITFYQNDFGQIGEATQDIRTVNFGTFSVGEGRGDIQAYTAQEATVKNKLIGGQKIELNYQATAPTTGHIEFEVLGKDGKGAMYVKVNGNEIFKEKLVTTGTPSINISSDVLKPGENKIVIGTTKGGLFSSTEYSIEDVEVTVNDRKFNDYEKSFRVYQYEIEEFAAANLSFTLPIDSSTRTAPLEVFVNDEQVFSQRISRSTQSISIDREQINTGYNTVRFETEGNARYDLENIDLTVRYFGTIEPGTATASFDMNQSSLSFANREETSEYVNFNYVNLMPSQNPVQVTVNSFSETITPRGFSVVKIPEETLQEENTLRISSNGSYIIRNLNVLSQRPQE